MREQGLLAVVLPHATFGLIIEGGVCVEAPPIARRSRGRSATDLIGYWTGRGARVVWVKDPE